MLGFKGYINMLNEEQNSDADLNKFASDIIDEIKLLPPYKSSTPSGQKQYEVNLVKFLSDKFKMKAADVKNIIKQAVAKDTSGQNGKIIMPLQSHAFTIVKILYQKGEIKKLFDTLSNKE